MKLWFFLNSATKLFTYLTLCKSLWEVRPQGEPFVGLTRGLGLNMSILINYVTEFIKFDIVYLIYNYFKRSMNTQLFNIILTVLILPVPWERLYEGKIQPIATGICLWHVQWVEYVVGADPAVLHISPEHLLLIQELTFSPYLQHTIMVTYGLVHDGKTMSWGSFFYTVQYFKVFKC